MSCAALCFCCSSKLSWFNSSVRFCSSVCPPPPELPML
ncbi:hypothetical protein VP434O481_P0003 [Vibrio phage 434O48-1]|nr:hypothetical protein VP434O481_P0003 [Vibrio phage 434O48-1]